MLITTAQVKEHLKINATVNEKTFTPFIPDATAKYIKPILGDELLTLLETWTQNQDPEEDDYQVFKDLYDKVIPALSRFTFFIAAPHFDINVGESGFSVTSNQNFAPASKERVERFMFSLEKLAWDSAEELIRFLEENKEDYPEWVESDAYTMQLRNLINSAEEFDKYVDIDKSRLTFQKMRHEMDNIEIMEVVPVISQELFDTLMGKIQEDEGATEITEKEEELLTHLRYFVANKAVNKMMGRDTSLVFTFHIKEAKALLNLYPDDFPDFRDSDLYDEDDPDIPPFSDYDNTEDSSIFVACT